MMNRIYHKICPECNTQFTSNSTGRKYCSDACWQKVKQRKGAEYRQRKAEKTEKGKGKKKLSIAEIDAAARETGMTYGQYVALHNL